VILSANKERSISSSSLNYQALNSLEFNAQLGVGNEEFCRYVWSFNIKKSPWRAIGNRQSGKPVTSFRQFYLDAEAYVPEKGAKRCSVDCFISPNEFFDWRNTKQLASLHANWIEIDTNDHGKGILSKKDESKVVTEVFSQLQGSGLPLPTSYVLSGSGGLHLYWIYPPTNAFRWRINAWREITNQLIKGLHGGELWHVDIGASRDPARVLRMPGTIHKTSGRTVQAFSIQKSYTFEELANELNISIVKPDHLKIVSSVKKVTRPRVDGTTQKQEQTKAKSGKHTIGQWWFKIYTHVIKHARQEGVKEGRRDSTAFILYVALRHMKDEEDAFNVVKSLNNEFIGLDSKSLSDYLKTARKTLYKYKKESIAAYLSLNLGMDVSFLYSNTTTKLTKTEIRFRQSLAAIATAQAKKLTTLQTIKNAINELKLCGEKITQAKVAQLTEKSVRTVRRYWGDMSVYEVIRSASIYSPPREGVLFKIKS